EYSRSGSALLEVRFPGKDQSYRALFTSTWVGTPYYPPKGALRRAHGQTTVYMSWNGATGVTRWQVLAATSNKLMHPVATVRKVGFETAIALKGSYSFFEVRALRGRGQVIGDSGVFR